MNSQEELSAIRKPVRGPADYEIGMLLRITNLEIKSLFPYVGDSWKLVSHSGKHDYGYQFYLNEESYSKLKDAKSFTVLAHLTDHDRDAKLCTMSIYKIKKVIK